MIRILLILAILILILCGCDAPPADTTPAQHPTVPPQESNPDTTHKSVPETTVTATAEPKTAPLLLLLEDMTMEEKVGQLFLARHPETGSEADMLNYHLGGYILFGRDFDNQTPESIRQMLAGYQDTAKIGLLIAVDEEGGTVCRVSSHQAFRSNRFPSPRNLYDDGGIDAAVSAEAKKSELLHSLGINVNMAPVCDITTDPDAFMYRRSLGQSPEVTGTFISQAVKAMDQYHVGSVLKHFPGYGNNVDTHVGIATDTRSLSELESCDLIPFHMGIEAGCDAILVSHTFINAVDEEFPASLSPAVHSYIRNNMGFDGVIVTDDLAMQAITDQYGAEEAAVLAVLAGNDLLCSTEYTLQYSAVLEAVMDGRISEELINAAVTRILQWKQHLGLLSVPADGRNS